MVTKAYLSALGALYGAGQPPRPKKRRLGLTIKESDIQIQLVSWADQLGLPLFSIPNQGKRSWHAAQREVAMGLTAGVSDLFLPVMRSGMGGFWIELKAPGKKPTQKQYEWLELMRTNGYAANWYDSFTAAQKAIEDYMKG